MSVGWQDLGRVEDFPSGEGRVFEVRGREIVVVNSDGRFFAIDNRCTHDGEELASGPVEGDQIICPRHGARFCLKTGAALTPPAHEPVKAYEVRVAEGRVTLRGGA
ncbi:MAG TPA: non-heme iron oxygenase ferredoxin subunit [Steroidobacteraceae bacterium]|nr:non-heme iron oxygenase ferredoxin subunit [Steroidobacteraceae bacterium]